MNMWQFIASVFKGPSIRREHEKLLLIVNEIGLNDVVAAKLKLTDYEQQTRQVEAKLDSHMTTMKDIDQQIAAKRAELIEVEEALLLETFALYTPKFKFQTSGIYKTRLEFCRNAQKEMIKSGVAVTCNENWTVNNSKTEGKKMVADMKKLMLRSFNNECDYCVDNVKFDNINKAEDRIRKSFDALNKLGRIMNGLISKTYMQHKLDELHMAYEYAQKKQEEKEEARRAREELREQQKLEQEIRQAREKIAKERKHFSRAIKELEARLKDADERERVALESRLSEVRSQCAELDNEEKAIDYREQNAKAGYVYIISNLGSFGKDVYKIGMTRRLEPLDRVDELGDASVPFTFDVHALIFSENAPALEAKLHEHFAASRLNRVNYRKEFFRADIHEIERVVRSHYDQAVDVIIEAPAEQYRESLRMVG